MLNWTLLTTVGTMLSVVFAAGFWIGAEHTTLIDEVQARNASEKHITDLLQHLTDNQQRVQDEHSALLRRLGVAAPDR